MWHNCLKGGRSAALNSVLSTNGLESNIVRDNSVYNTNHAFWATRPLTATMVEWASGDVGLLLQLYVKQKADASESQASAADRGSCEYASFARDKCQVAMVTVLSPGRFIGKGGANFRHLQSRSNALVYGYGPRGEKRFMVFYPTARALEMVRVAAAKRY